MSAEGPFDDIDRLGFYQETGLNRTVSVSAGYGLSFCFDTDDVIDIHVRISEVVYDEPVPRASGTLEQLEMLLAIGGRSASIALDAAAEKIVRKDETEVRIAGYSDEDWLLQWRTAQRRHRKQEISQEFAEKLLVRSIVDSMVTLQPDVEMVTDPKVSEIRRKTAVSAAIGAVTMPANMLLYTELPGRPAIFWVGGLVCGLGAIASARRLSSMRSDDSEWRSRLAYARAIEDPVVLKQSKNSIRAITSVE